MSDLNTTVLKATLGAGYVDDRYTLPKGGSPGDIPVKTEKGVEWQKPEPATSTPDWNQNDPAASDYIKNRPGGYTVEYPELTIEWDGVVGDRVSVDAGDGALVKVSDAIPTAEQMGGAIATVVDDSVDVAGIVTADDLYYVTDGMMIDHRSRFAIIEKDGTTINDITFPESGVYSISAPADNLYMSSLRIPAKRTLVPIPGELTSIVGGYDVSASQTELFSGTIKAESFVLMGGE